MDLIKTTLVKLAAEKIADFAEAIKDEKYLVASMYEGEAETLIFTIEQFDKLISDGLYKLLRDSSTYEYDCWWYRNVHI